jgi:hypothetical protein
MKRFTLPGNHASPLHAPPAHTCQAHKFSIHSCSPFCTPQMPVVSLKTPWEPQAFVTCLSQAHPSALCLMTTPMSAPSLSTGNLSDPQPSSVQPSVTHLHTLQAKITCDPILPPPENNSIASELASLHRDDPQNLFPSDLTSVFPIPF